MCIKNYKVANIIIVGLLILVAIFSVGLYFSQPQTFALANNEFAQQVPTDIPVESVIPQNINQKVLSKTKNDITVDITSTRIISTGIEIGICYTASDNGEWRPMPGHLFYGSYDVLPDEIEFLPEETLADGKHTGLRCAFIRYLIEDLSAISAPMEFSILRFYAPGREMYTPCQELQQRLISNPKANAYGLKAKCTESGDGTISVTLIENNKSVAKDKASKLLDEIARAEVDGPWEFTITEIAK